MTTDQIVLTSGIVTFGSTMAATILPTKLGGHGQAPPIKLLVGTGLAFFGISTLASIAPALGVPLAIIVAFTALTLYGLPLLEGYTKGNLGP